MLFHVSIRVFSKLSLLCSAFHHFPVVSFCLRGGIVTIRRFAYGTASGAAQQGRFVTATELHHVITAAEL